MAYSIRLPDGTLVENIPDSVTPEEAKRRIIAKYPEFGPKGESGFIPAFKAGVESLKGQAALTAGKLGLMGLPEAEKFQAEREAEAQRIFKPTEKSWTEAPFEKFKETLGGSLPYMAAPLAAAGATLALPVTGTAAAVAAGAAAGLTSAGQFTGSNLARQLEEVKRIDPNAGLEQTSGATAFIAAVPQAALDVVSFRALPLVRNLFKSVGKELTEAQAKEIAQQGFKRTLADYAATGARTAGIEGVTETGQQFIERLQAGLKIADADARREYVDSFIGGAVLGGAISPVGRYFERGSEQARAETKIKQEVARRRAEEERGKAEAAELADRQRRAEEAGVPLFAADQRALDLAEAAVTGPQMQAPAPVVDRTQETQELQQDYARVSRAIEDYQKQIAQATQTGDVDAVAAMSQQLSPLIQGRKQIEEQLASINAVPDPMEALKALQAEEAKLLKNMQKQAELGESQKAGELAQKIKTLRAERQRLEAQAPQVGGEQLFMETPAGFAYPEATRRAERTAEEVDTGYQAELPPAKTAETLEGRMAERQEKMRGEEARAAEEQARRDVKQLAKLMMGSAETEDIALQRVERSLDSPVSLRALGLIKPEERAQYMDAVRKGELSPLVKKLLGLQSIDQIEDRVAQERRKLQSYLAEDKQLVSPDNTFTPDGLKAFATQVRINELNTLKRNQPEKRVEDLGVPAEELLVRGDDALRIAKLQKERDTAVKQSQEAKTALDALTAQPEASEEQLAAAQQRYDTTLRTVTQRDTEIEQIKAKVKVGGAKARESVKDAQSRQDQEFSNFASALDELRQTKLGQTERGYRYYVASMAEEAAARGQEYMMPTFEQFKKDSLAKRKEALQQAVTYRNNYIIATIDEIDATRRAEGVSGVGTPERNALTKQLARKMDELMIRGQEYYPEVIGFKIQEELIEPAVMRQGKIIREARYKKVVEEIRRPQELPRFTPSKNITREQLAADMKAGTQAARPFARALFVTQEELAEIRDKALAREARPARSFIPGEQFTLPGIEPAPRKAAVVAEEKEEVPEGGIPEGQLELFSPERVEQEAKRTLPELRKELQQIEGSLKGKKMPLAQFGAQYASAQRRTKEIKAEIARLEKAPAALRQDRKEREAELQDMLAGKKPMKYVLLDLGTTRASPANFQRLLNSIRLKTPTIKQAQAAVTNVVKPTPEFQATVDELAALQVQLGMLDQSTSAAQAAVTYSTFAQRQAALNAIAKILKEDAAKLTEPLEVAKADVSTMSAQMLTRDFALERMQAIDAQLKETKAEINDAVTKINELTKEQDQGRAASMADSIQEQINALSNKLADLYTVKSYFEYVAPSKADALTAWLNTFKALSKAQNTLFNLQNDNGRAQVVEVLNQRKRELEQRRDMLLFKPDDEKTVKAKERIAFAQDNYDDVSKRFRSLETYIDGFEDRKNAALAPLKAQLAKERDRIKQYEKLPAAYKSELKEAYRDADKIVQETVNTINKLEADLAKAQLDFDRTTDERNISAAQLAKAVETLYKNARTYMRYDSRTGAVEVVRSGSAAPTSGEIDARIDRANREFARGKQMLETTKKLSETRKALDAEREQLAAVQLGLNLPGTKVERKAVVVETDEDTIELKKKYDREVKNIRSQLSKLKKQVEKGEQDKVGPATSKMAMLYGKMEALRQDLAILQDQPVQRLDVQPITAAPFNLEALEKAQLGRIQKSREKETQAYEQRIQDIDKQIAEAKGAQRARLRETKKLLLKQKEIHENTGGNIDFQALELAQALENARMGTVRADKSIPRISEEQLAAQVGVYKNDIKAIDKALAAKGKKTKIEGPLRDTLITAKDNRLEAIKEIQTLINASNERIAAIIDENFNKPKGTPKTRATEAAKLQYEIDAMSYSAPDVKKAAKDYGFKSAEYARALRDARRNAIAHMSELENVPQAQSIRDYFERKGILKSRGQVENPTTVAEVRKVIQGAFPLVTDWDNKNVYVYPDVKSLGKNIGEYYNVPTDARGFVTPYGEVYLIASNIPKGQELAVFLHEVGAHVGFRNMLGDAQYKALVNQVETWAKRDDGSQESKIAKAAMRRVDYAFADETPDVETRDDEILAYFVEEAVIAGVNPTEKGKGPVAGFLYRLYENFKKIIGKLLGPDFAKEIKNMTAQDFVDFAYGAADFELRGEWHGTGVTFQEFDHSYMGTGEGMQAYMWGTYTGTKPGTALSYAKQELEKKIARTPEIKFDKETGVKFNGKTRAELSAIRDKAFDNWLNTLSVENRERRNKSNVISEIADEISDYIAIAVKFGKDYKRKDLYDALISNDKTELVNALFRELKERSSITTYNNISFKELYNILKDFSFEYEVIQNKPVTYLKRVIRERKEDEYWELEKPLSEQSKHVQNSFDALLNDLASPEDAAMLKELLDKENNRLFAANLFPAYLYAQQSLFGSATKSSTSDRKKLILASAKDPYFREGAAHTQLQKATAELLWTYGIAGNKHQGAKAANYVNFYDKNQQILTAAEVSDLKEGVKDVLGTKGATRRVLFSVNYPADMPANVADTVQRITGAEQGVVERLKNTLRGGEFRARFVDRLDPLEQVLKYAKDNELAQAQQMFEAVYYSRMHDQRMNFTSAVVNHGGMKMVQRPKADGSMEFIPEAGFGVSLREISESLRESGIDADAANRLFTTYMAHQRAKNNPSVGLRKLNFNTDPAKGGISVDMLKDVDAYINSKPEIKDAFEKARTQYNEYNKNLINFLEATGAISKDLAKTLNATKDYIPFYRVDEKKEQVFLSIGTEDVPINIGSLKEQPYLRELVGGNEHIVDFFTSSVQNTTILTDMALRNLASSRVATSLKALGFAEIKPNAKPEGPNVVRFKVNGETQSAVLSEEKLDELGIDASILVKGLEGVSMTLPFMARMFTGPAQVLRKFVTRNPVYMLRQIVRDTSAAVLVTGADITPVYSAIKQFPSMVKGTSNVEEILKKRGVFGGQTITGSSEDMAKLLRDLAKGGKTLNFQLARLDELSMKADAATRMTLYEDFRAKGMSEMEATLGALESMNFGRRGYSPTAYMLSMLVPFMNAQIQGLDVVYRAFTGKMYGQDQLNVRKKLMTRGAMLAATAIAYAMLMQDDEAYQNAPADEKYNNFFVYIPGVSEPLRVPIPFELGYIFKSLPEMVYNMATTDETLQKNIPALKSMVVNSIPIGLPQFIKPALEVAVNYSFFGGRAIESERELDLTKAERVRQNTTEVSKLLSKMTTVTVGSKEYGLSPIEIDHLMRGYFGGLVPALMSVANPVLEEPTKVKPETRASGTILIGGLFQPKDATGLINFAYEQMYDIQQRQRTLKELETTGREADADIFYKENEYLLDLTKDAGRFKKKMGDLAKEERIVREDPGMTPSQKRKELDEIRAERIAFAKDMIAAVSENKRLAAR